MKFREFQARTGLCQLEVVGGWDGGLPLLVDFFTGPVRFLRTLKRGRVSLRVRPIQGVRISA